ncbi:hypothetical protein GCM10023192_32080 [Amycolatopsis samaneae]
MEGPRQTLCSPHALATVNTASEHYEHGRGPMMGKHENKSETTGSGGNPDRTQEINNSGGGGKHRAENKGK